MRRQARSFLVLAALALCAPRSAAQDFVVTDHYVKSEVMIPMRDGVELYTQIYEPLDMEGTHPIMLFRTPYGIGDYGPDLRRRTLGPSDLFAPAGFVFVYQDVRGKFRSEGEFEVMKPVYSRLRGPDHPDETTDTWDTIDWLIENVPDNNGRVGMWGISYPGWQTYMALIGAHPALRAASPQASPSDMFIGDDFHHNGAFRLMYTFGWLAGNAAQREGASSTGSSVDPTAGVEDPFRFFMELGPLVSVGERLFGGAVPTWDEYMTHGTYDAYWEERNALKHLDGVTPAVLNVAGWFDAEDFYGPMSIYYEIERRNPENRSALVVGPWPHGGWSFGPGENLGAVRFGARTSEFFRDEVEFPFFRRHLRGEGELDLPEALVFETGSNVWRRHDEWPPAAARAKALYLHEDGRLSFEMPLSGPGGDEGGFDEFVSDPADPVPFSASVGMAQGHLWMVEDQRFAAGRPDVLVYASEPLEEDLVIAGPIMARLRVSTTGTDADWIVKLIDVFPDDLSEDPLYADAGMEGYQMLVAGEVFRAKFRESFAEPVPLEPGVVTEIDFDLRDRYHCFRSGHRIMVQVQSTWFPVIDRNPQRFLDVYSAGKDDFQRATHRVHRSPDAPSHVELRVIGG